MAYQLQEINRGQDHHRHEDRGGAPAPGCQYPRGGYGQLLQEPESQDRRPAPPRGTSTTNPPQCLDMELLDQHFAALSRGEEIIIPKFEFARQMRNDARGTPLKLDKNEIAIFEGIHALNDDIAGRHPEAAKLYISARSNVNDGAALRFKGTWMRLTRRAVRDYNFRGTDVAETLEMWANVRRGEKLYISPFKNRADIIFDSSLPYEVSVMKNFALPLLQAVPEENAGRAELLELIEAFQWFEPIDPELVARTPCCGPSGTKVGLTLPPPARGRVPRASSPPALRPG